MFFSLGGFLVASLTTLVTRVVSPTPMLMLVEMCELSYSAFIFARPPSLQNIYDYLQLPVPSFAQQYLKYDQKVPTRPRWAGIFRGLPRNKGGSRAPITSETRRRTLSKKKLTYNKTIKKIKMPTMNIVLPTNPSPISANNIQAIKGFYSGISGSVIKAIAKTKNDNSR